MAEGSSFPEGAVPPRPFDGARFSQAVRLESSLYDYGLNENQKADVVKKLDENNDVLLQGIGQPAHRKNALNMLSNLFAPNDNIPALNGYGYGFVERNLEQLENIVTSSSDYTQKKEVLSLMLRLSESADKKQQQLLVGSLQSILKHEVSSPPDKGEKLGREDNYKTYLESFQKIFQLGSKEQVIGTTQFLAKAFDAASTPDQKRHIGYFIANTIWSAKERDPFDLKTQASRELVTHVMKHYGLDYAKFSKVWGNFSDNIGLMGMAHLNLEAIIDLESIRPDISKVLLDEFNIRVFHKYPPEVLLAQYDQRNDNNIPYGIMVNSITDHNEALSSLSMEGLMKSIHGEAQKNGFGIRIYEGGSEEDVKEYFDRSNQRYGIKTPQFALISGHGTPDSIQMNWDNPKQPSRTIRQQSFQGEPLLRFTDYMRDDSTLVLISCSTGVEGGIAQEISKQGLTVMGPDRDAAASDISVSKDVGELFNIHMFYRGAKTNTYRNGIIIAQAA